ncbi:hypothetical protein SSX86_009788 [Deinandra increscens subsp. villosa]|uniref:Protein kinase domain-containing protein n=1 Tax=Deinandra increscens subsp. villosa TaxID=3103831 RepID=A0AAP0H628_9ASTR
MKNVVTHIIFWELLIHLLHEMNLMVKCIFLVLQVYAIASSLAVQESSASSHFESATGPAGNKVLGPSSSPNTPLNEPPPDVAAPIRSIPEGSPQSPSVIPPTTPLSVPPIPQPEKGPPIISPVNPPTTSVQITPPPKNVLQNPPPAGQAAPPSMSQAPPPFILPEPVTPPPTNTPAASSPTSPALPLPVELPPSTLPSSPPMPPTTLPSSPPMPSIPLPSSPPMPPTTLPSSPPPMPPSTLPSSPPIPPTTLPSSPPMPPTTLPSSPPMPPSTLPSSPPMPPTTLPSSPPIPPTTLPSSPPIPPTTLPSSPPIPPTTLPSSPPIPPTTLPSSPPIPPTTLPSSPPMPPVMPVPPSNASAPVALPPSTLPRNSPPSQPTPAFPPPKSPAPLASPPSTLPNEPPPSPPTLTMPPPNLPAPVASPPHASQVKVPPPHPILAEPPSNSSVPVVASPPRISPGNLQPIHHNSSMPPPNLPEPHVSPVSAPILPSPSNRTTNDIAPSQPSPVKAPNVHKAPSSYNHAPPPHSSYESPPRKSHPPPSFPPVYPPPPPGPKINPTHHNPPPSAGPESNNPRHRVPTPPSLGPMAPPVENSISPLISPPKTSPSIQTTRPVISPKVSPPLYSPRIPKPLQALPPPPPNEDCSSITCMEPLTNTPPGTPCKCVLPMQVELGLGVSLYIFFPLVTELAFEMASGLFMRPSQVRIMGANEDSQDPEKTIVIINLVPLGEKFDNYTAYVTAQRLWLKQVPINSSSFGDYDVLFVKYPGLPPSPPMPSSSNGGNSPYGRGNNGRDIKPLGVDVSKQRHNNKLSGGVISIIALSAAVAVVLACVAVWVLVVKRRDHVARSGPNASAILPSVSKLSGVGGSMTGSGAESASASFRSTIAYNGTAKTFSSTDIEKATDNFNESGVLGEGGFGRVYSGILEDGTQVAVKVLKRDDQQGGREFLAEVEMLSRLHHRNLVRLIGICTEERNRCLVYELIANGSVESHLHGIDKEIAPLDWGARLKIALGAARGLAYLHEDSSPRVIHRDFKSSNILLEHDFTPKVSDFGLARSALDEENQHISTRVMGTFGYVAPEYAMTGHLLVKSDVYSYGVVLLELLSGRKPIDMSMPSGQENLVAWARPLLPTTEGLNLLIDPSLSPEVPFDSIAKVAAIASMCVQPEVSHRPFMGEVVQALKLVCNECEETRDLGSRSCSHEDLASMDFDPRASTNTGLGMGPGPGPSRSTYESYESPLDVESGFSGLGMDVDSYMMGSSSGPLRPRRRLQIWERVKRFSSGSMNDYGDLLRFLSRSR